MCSQNKRTKFSLSERPVNQSVIEYFPEKHLRIVHKWKNAKEAAATGKYTYVGIMNTCKGYQNTHAGYVWEIAD
jgi:hypothetical protein